MIDTALMRLRRQSKRARNWTDRAVLEEPVATNGRFKGNPAYPWLFTIAHSVHDLSRNHRKFSIAMHPDNEDITVPISWQYDHEISVNDGVRCDVLEIKLLILHISDIHFKDPLCHDNRDPELYFRTELVNHAIQQVQELGDVDAILITGDIAFRGISSEYEAATRWFEKLCTKVGCDKRRIYVVPGNHDVDRNTFKTNEGARNAVRAIAIAGDNAERERELSGQLRLPDSAANVFASIAEYNLFAAKYDCQSYPGRLGWNHTLRIDSQTVLSMYGLNSCIVSGIDDDDQQGQLYMSALQMNVPSATGTVNLVMAHHPAEWMSDQADVEMRLLGAPNMVLFGHRHKQLVRRDVGGPLIFSAGSVNPNRHDTGWEPSYNMIEVRSEIEGNLRSVVVGVRQYRWQSNPSGFVPKMDLAANSPIFIHRIAIQGENDKCGGELSRSEIGGDAMPKSQDSPSDSVTVSGPNVRDLIYRFWELEPRDRVEVLDELGLEKIAAESILQTMAYRSALLTLAKENRLGELQAAIESREQ